MFIKQRTAIVEWAEHHENLFDDRLNVVSGLYLLSFLVLDVAPWKACVLVLTIHGCLILQIGQRTIATLCILLFAAAMARWTDIAGINELAETARQSLVHLAQH
jgi:hypothetical protein